jgi:hypothetical protein
MHDTVHRSAMRSPLAIVALFCFTVVLAFVTLTGIGAAQVFRPEIPRAWNDREVATFELPLAQRDRSPRFMTSIPCISPVGSLWGTWSH